MYRPPVFSPSRTVRVVRSIRATHLTPSLEQQAFRIRNDNGSETTATWVANQNTNATLNVDTNYRIRFQVQENGGESEVQLFQLQYNLNSAGYNNVDGASSVVRASASANFADGDNTTQQLTGGSGTFTAGEMDENDGTGTQITVPASGYTEWEYCFQVRSADVANNDTVQLRVIRGPGSLLDTYTVTPAITVSEATADHAIARMHAVRGVKTTGDPWNITSGNVEAASDTSLSATGATTTNPDSLVLIFAALMDDDQDFGATWTNADLANIIVRSNTPGVAGNDGRHILVTGEKASAGAYGATTNTLTASSVKAMMTVALEGAPNVHTGAGSPVVSAPAIAAVGVLAFIGSAALAVAQPSVSGSGALIEAVTGSGALAVSAPAISGTGTLRFTATGALSVTPPAIAGSGEQFFDVTGTAALGVAAPAIAGTGSITQASVTGEGALSVPAPSLAATGVLGFAGSGAPTVSAPSISGSGAESFDATGALSVTVTLAGTGAETFVGTAALTVPAPAIQGGEEGVSGGVIAVHVATVAIVDTHSGTGAIVRRHGTSIMDTYTADNDSGTADSTHHTADDAPMGA